MKKEDLNKSRFCLQYDDHAKVISNVLCSMMEHQSLVDLAVRCGNNTIHVHKCVLAANSNYFKDQLEKNTDTEQVVIHGLDFSVVKALIEFMYCGETNVVEENLKYLVAAAKFFQMRGVQSIAHDKNQFNPDEVTPIPAPTFLSKKPKYSNTYLPFNNPNVPNGMDRNVLQNDPSYHRRLKRKYMRTEAEKACAKEAAASRLALEALQKELANTSQVSSFVIEESCTETTVENFIPHTDDAFVDNLAHLSTVPLQVVNYSELNHPISGQIIAPKGSLVNYGNGNSEHELMDPTTEKLKHILGTDNLPNNVEIMFKTSEGNFVSVTEEVLANLSRGSLQYQLVDENGHAGELQEISVSEKLPLVNQSSMQSTHAQSTYGQNTYGQNTYAQNINSQNTYAQNINSQNTYAQNINVQNINVQNMNAQNMNAQNMNAQNTYAQNIDASSTGFNARTENVKKRETDETLVCSSDDNARQEEKNASAMINDDYEGMIQECTNEEGNPTEVFIKHVDVEKKVPLKESGFSTRQFDGFEEDSSNVYISNCDPLSEACGIAEKDESDKLKLISNRKAEFSLAEGLLNEDIYEGIKQEKHFESKHFEPKNFESKNFDSTNFESKSFESKNFESKSFESKKFESKDFESKDFESKHFESKHFESKHFESKNFEPRNLESKNLESKNIESKVPPTKYKLGKNFIDMTAEQLVKQLEFSPRKTRSCKQSPDKGAIEKVNFNTSSYFEGLKKGLTVKKRK